MSLITLGLLLLNSFHCISSHQIPVVNGVIGGVRSVRSTPKIDLNVQSFATTPGKLRHVENSGICGKGVLGYIIILWPHLSSETTPGVFQASG